MDYQERHSQALVKFNEGLRRVAELPTPKGQKFPIGARVRIADDLGEFMQHFPGSGMLATVKFTHAHAYGGDDTRSYCLDVDGIGRVSWYYEEQLSLVAVNGD